MTFTIDIVYAWCGEASEGSAANPRRHRDCHELQYSLRSIYKYMKWVNHIFILVNKEDMQPPAWCNDPSQNLITFVNRSLLFDNDAHTPTFNTYAVHAVVHKIPGLSEHFVVMDDDIFFNNYVSPSYFFDILTTKPIIRFKRERCRIYDEDMSGNFPVYKYKNIEHQPLPFKKGYIELFNKKYPEYSRFVQSHRYRYHNKQEGSTAENIFLAYFDFAFIQGDLMKIDITPQYFFQIPHKHNINILPEFKLYYNILQKNKKIRVFNCNDDFSIHPAHFRSQLAVLEIFYEKLYPEIPWFEIPAKTQNSSIVIAGCAQNVDKYLEYVFNNIYKITSLFNEYKIIIFENGSTDSTYYTLEKYAKGDSNIILVTQKDIPIRQELLPQRVAYCRNRLLSNIARYCPNYDYMVMMDMDDVCAASISISNFLSVFNNPKWDAVSFNRPVYYDIWALRFGIFTRNCWNLKTYTECARYTKQLRQQIMNKLKHVDMFPVESAFCGFAIYKLSKIIGCRYDGINREKFRGLRFLEDCEHVAFHKQMREEKNAQIYICSKKLFNYPHS